MKKKNVKKKAILAQAKIPADDHGMSVNLLSNPYSEMEIDHSPIQPEIPAKR